LGMCGHAQQYTQHPGRANYIAFASRAAIGGDG